MVAPGHGKVISISEVDEPTFMGGTARRITIFLSVFDIHVQRAPVSGTVEHRVYKPGKYLVAWNEKASADNEQAFWNVLDFECAGGVHDPGRTDI